MRIFSAILVSFSVTLLMAAHHFACDTDILFAQEVSSKDFQHYCSDEGFRRKRFSRYCKRIWLRDTKAFCDKTKNLNRFQLAHGHFCLDYSSRFELVGPKQGAMILHSTPPGMSISINGKKTGKQTPTRLDKLDPDYYNILLTKDGYFSWSKRVRIAMGQEIKLDAKVKPKTVVLKLDFNRKPDSLEIDGKKYGPETRIFKLLPGKHKLLVKKAGYYDFLKAPKLELGKDKALKIELKRAFDISNMVLIEGGSFLMGSSESAGNEKPTKKVKLEDFYIDKYEVSVKDYQKCVKQGKCKKPLSGDDLNWKEEKNSWNIFSSDTSEHPVNGVSWQDAHTYCTYLHKRLPTESEWEMAATWKKGKKYPYTNSAKTINCDYAVMDKKGFFGGPGCGKEGTWPVGSKPAELNGTFDLAGNVREWTGSIYMKAVQKPEKQIYSFDKKSAARTVKGGSWKDKMKDLKGTIRKSVMPHTRSREIGFRCVAVP